MHLSLNHSVPRLIYVSRLENKTMLEVFIGVVEVKNVEMHHFALGYSSLELPKFVGLMLVFQYGSGF